MLQEADFLYLTGIAQPQVVAILGGNDSPAPGYTLFVADSNAYVRASSPNIDGSGEQRTQFEEVFLDVEHNFVGKTRGRGGGG